MGRRSQKQTASESVLEAQGLEQEASPKTTPAKSLTERTYEQVQPYVDSAKEHVQPYVDSAVDVVGPYVDSAKEHVQPYVDSAKERVQPYVDSAITRVQPYVDVAKPYVDSAIAHVDTTIQNTKHAATEASNAARVTVLAAKDRVDDTVEKAHELVETAKSKAAVYVDSAKDHVAPVVESAKVVVDKTTKIVSDTKKRAVDARDVVADTVKPRAGETVGSTSYRVALTVFIALLRVTLEVVSWVAGRKYVAATLQWATDKVHSVEKSNKYQSKVVPIVERSKPHVTAAFDTAASSSEQLLSRVPRVQFVAHSTVHFVKQVLEGARN